MSGIVVGLRWLKSGEARSRLLATFLLGRVKMVLATSIGSDRGLRIN